MRMLALPLLLLSGCVAANSEQACRVVPLATVPLRMSGRLPFLDAAIDGRPVHFQLDTGASGVLINDAAADRLGLTFLMDLPPAINRGLDSQTPLRVTNPVRITLAGQELKPLPLSVIPTSSAIDSGAGVDGLLGMRAFDGYDLDIDLHHRRLVLNQARNCAAGPSPLAGRTVTYPSPPNSYNLVFVPGRVDGRDISMLVDTGANSTLFDRDQLGLHDEDVVVDRETMAKTSGPGSARLRVHRFAEVQTADVVVKNGTFLIGQLPLGMAAILGNDFWLQHRLWLSPTGGASTIQLAPPSAR